MSYFDSSAPEYEVGGGGLHGGRGWRSWRKIVENEGERRASLVYLLGNELVTD